MNDWSQAEQAVAFATELLNKRGMCPSCAAKIRPDNLFCRTCWKLVPTELRTAVNEAARKSLKYWGRAAAEAVWAARINRRGSTDSQAARAQAGASLS